MDADLGPLEGLRPALEQLGLPISGKVTRRTFGLTVTAGDAKIRRKGSNTLRAPLTLAVWFSLISGTGLFLINKYIVGPNPALVIFPGLVLLFGIGKFAKVWLDQDFHEHLTSPLTRAEAVSHRLENRLLEILIALWAIRTAPIGSRFRNVWIPRKTYENDAHLFMAAPLEAAIKQLARNNGMDELLEEYQLQKKAVEVAEHLGEYKKMYQRTVRPAYALVYPCLWLSTAITALFVWKWLAP